MAATEHMEAMDDVKDQTNLQNGTDDTSKDEEPASDSGRTNHRHDITTEGSNSLLVDSNHSTEGAETKAKINVNQCNDQEQSEKRHPSEHSGHFSSSHVQNMSSNSDQVDDSGIINSVDKTAGKTPPPGHIVPATGTQKMEIIVRKVPKGARPSSNTSDLFNPDPRTNTPASGLCGLVTPFPEFTTTKMMLGSQCNGENSRDSMFQQAIHLMTERCPSMALTTYSETGVPLVQHQNQPFGPNVPKYFYVEQKNPSPMTPLPAWRGYNGNVYFQPIKVNPAQYSVPTQPESPPLDKCSDQLKDILVKSRRVQSSKSLPMVLAEDPPSSPVPRHGRSMTAGTRGSINSGKSGKNFAYKGNRQMVHLDKKTVFDRTNERLPEDIVWIVGQESTGSLRVDQAAREKRLRASRTAQAERTINKPQANHNLPQQQRPSSFQVKKVSSQVRNTREKICRGSVAHKIYAMKNKMLPFLSVTGDRYSHQPVPPSPILRTQTQYSQSNQRTINSPDLYHTGYERLPPLEQLRASLKQMETANQGSLMHVIPPLERIKFEDTDSITKNKPLIKYSAEVKNSARRSRQMPSGQQQRVL